MVMAWPELRVKSLRLSSSGPRVSCNAASMQLTMQSQEPFCRRDNASRRCRSYSWEDTEASRKLKSLRG